MTTGEYVIPLPLAALSDLAGILIFVVIAIVSALGKRKQQEGGEQSGGSPEPEKETVEDWFKQLTEQAREKVERFPPAESIPSPLPASQGRAYQRPSAAGPATPPVRDPYRRIAQRPSRFSSVATRTPPSLPEKVSRKPFGKPSPPAVPGRSLVANQQPDIHAEIQRFTKQLKEEVHFTESELVAAAQPSVPSAQPTTFPGASLNMAMFRSLVGLKQAIVAAEILGKPRSLSPFQKFGA